jgi:DNA invertase Pin-like site-specific DNA recombinase
MSREFVAYYRVSTVRQGDSGLGLEAQQQAVYAYVERERGSVVRSYVEIESGARCGRPKLREAIEACRRERSVLVIAKLDRLARSVHLISGLMESGVEFVAVDNPHANRLMLHLLAAFAEHEREQISRRTKEALAAAKRRGVALGRYGTTLAAKNRAAADSFARETYSKIGKIEGHREMPLISLADRLNSLGMVTSSGRPWTCNSVCRVRRRAELLLACGSSPEK